MWMQYSSENWTKAEDLDSAIDRLCQELCALSMDADHAINYDMNMCFDEDRVQYCKEKSERYSKGANICNQYCHGLLNLEEFCKRMVRFNLGYFLYSIKKYLPHQIIEKYRLYDDEDDEDGDTKEKDGDTNEKDKV